MPNLPHTRCQETPHGVAIDHLDDDWTVVTVQGWDFEVLLAVDPLGKVQVWAYDPRDRDQPDRLTPIATAAFDAYAALQQAGEGSEKAEAAGRPE